MERGKRQKQQQRQRQKLYKDKFSGRDGDATQRKNRQALPSFVFHRLPCWTSSWIMELYWVSFNSLHQFCRDLHTCVCGRFSMPAAKNDWKIDFDSRRFSVFCCFRTFTEQNENMQVCFSNLRRNAPMQLSGFAKNTRLRSFSTRFLCLPLFFAHWNTARFHVRLEHT